MTKLLACYNKDMKIRMNSSSGGIYYPLAKKIISDGGVVYGACYEGTNVYHRRINSMDKIKPSCGSKYQPSILEDTFRKVRIDLQNGLTVFFTGTPCQCEGLCSYVGSSDSLYCADFICHGIPSKKAWRKYLLSMKKHGINITSVNMRDKSSGWQEYSWKLTDSNETEYIQTYSENAFMKGFLSDIYLRPSCYECFFKGIDRKTDFTLGDYWGVQRIQPELFDNNGISLVFIHSEKGLKLFDGIIEEIYCFDAPLHKVVETNPSCIYSNHKPIRRKEFFEKIDEGYDFIQLVNDMTKESTLKLLARRVKNMIKFRRGGRVAIKRMGYCPLFTNEEAV